MTTGRKQHRTAEQSLARRALWSGLGLALFLAASPRAQLAFEDATERSGLSSKGSSYGLAWGDFDGDGFPDLFLGNHKNTITLHRNRGDGTFEDVTERVFVDRRALAGDHHGGAFADLDNDGDLDLLVAAGAGRGVGQGANKVFLQHAGQFHERAQELGLDYPLARGRTMRTLDLGGDGLLDVLCVATERPDGRAGTAIFARRADELVFDDVSARHPISGRGQRYAHQLWLPGHGHLLAVRDRQPRVYALDDLGGVDLTPVLGLRKVGAAQDSVYADFDNDGDLDLFTTHWDWHSGAWWESPHRVEFTLLSVGEPVSLRLRQQAGAGKLRLHLHGVITREQVLLGREGRHPTADEYEYQRIDLDLSSFDPRVRGMYSGEAPSTHLRVGWQDTTRTWIVEFRAPVWTEVRGVAVSPAASTELEIVGALAEEVEGDTLLWFDGERYRDAWAEAGIAAGLESHSVAAGDFDNDMDLDIYVVRSNSVANLPNEVYENLGDGRFRRRVDGAGAAGTLLGHGDWVAVADVDGDGFLDLGVTNGSGGEPFESDGPVQLFRNVGNDNHWLGIDLVGLHAPRDALGAMVRVTAGGVTQMRYQDGGLHGYGQDHARLHFGLGPHRQAERVVVRWPNGFEQQLTGVLANRVHRIEEPR